MWKTLSKVDFEKFLSNLKEKNSNVTIKTIKAYKLIKDKGAFVKIGNKNDVNQLFLSDICVIYGNELSENYDSLLTEDFYQACFVTAESKTADIEKKLVSGVHGPKECYFVILQ